ncbi:MAG: VOC family protein [Rhodobacter sp.]|nr:VOC family protein [Rhodobacter sp.]
MALIAFDHVNIRTARLNAMVAWYGEVLGLHPGPRPPFGFPGAWLYLGEQALVHLVGVDAPPAGRDPGLEHFAMRAKGLAEFLDRVDRLGVPVELAEVPGIGVLQVNIHDPDGNHIHIDFDATERELPDAD